MPLTTRCGRCGRLFPVYAQELKARRGRVNCPQCGNRFDGLAALLDEPKGGYEASSGRARLGMGARRPTTTPLATARPASHSQTSPAGPAAAAPQTHGAATRARGGAGVWWGLAALVLTLALTAQAAWWKRADLLRDPQARDWLAIVCEGLGCKVPTPRIPGTLAVFEPTLTPEPDARALVLRLSVRNDAALDQPPPLIELELYDQQGDLAATRRFTPAQYAPGGDPLIAPGETLDASLAIAMPESETSGFKVRLL